jgi:hypothetical protein
MGKSQAYSISSEDYRVLDSIAKKNGWSQTEMIHRLMQATKTHTPLDSPNSPAAVEDVSRSTKSLIAAALREQPDALSVTVDGETYYTMDFIKRALPKLVGTIYK